MAFYTYLLRCSDRSYYTGHTEDLETRLVAHQQGVLKGYTQSRRPVNLVWCEMFETRDEAFQAEFRIKGWRRSKKDALVAQDWIELVRVAAVRSPERAGPMKDETSFFVEALAHPTSASG